MSTTRSVRRVRNVSIKALILGALRYPVWIIFQVEQSENANQAAKKSLQLAHFWHFRYQDFVIVCTELWLSSLEVLLTLWTLNTVYSPLTMYPVSRLTAPSVCVWNLIQFQAGLILQHTRRICLYGLSQEFEIQLWESWGTKKPNFWVVDKAPEIWVGSAQDHKWQQVRKSESILLG